MTKGPGAYTRLHDFLIGHMRMSHGAVAMIGKMHPGPYTGKPTKPAHAR